MSSSQVVHSQSNNWWRKAFVAPSEQSKQRLIWTERELQTSLDQCNAMQCKSSLKVTRKSFQGGDLIFTGAGEIAFDAYKEWFVSWGPAGKIKVCMISPKNSYHPMGRYLGLCSPYMKNDKTKFWQLLSYTYFSSSGEDSATEHRVHERLHPKRFISIIITSNPDWSGYIHLVDTVMMDDSPPWTVLAASTAASSTYSTALLLILPLLILHLMQ